MDIPTAPGLATGGPMVRPMVRLRRLELCLSAAAGPVEILKGIDLEVTAGETLSVVGPSGSGKTSMIMVIAGLERPTGGLVEIAGVDLAGLDEDRLALFRRARIGIVFQAFHLIQSMTALENVAVPLEFAGRADAFDRAKACLDQVGLSDRLGHYPGQLSGGEQQRVALARAFAPEPDLLLADEPTGNLDGETGGIVVDLLFQLQADHGSTLVMITHDRDLASRCARQVSLLDGRIEADSGLDLALDTAGARG